MSIHGWMALAVAALALAVLATTRRPAHQVMLGATGVCLALGIISPAQLVPCVFHEGLWTVAALLVVARGLGASGLVSRVAQWLLRADRDAGRPSARFLVPVALASAFVNNTPVVATLAPAVVRWCERHGRSPQPLLIPLSYATILGGTCTLVGTSTNLIVAGQARAAGLPPLSLFSLTPVGLVVTVAGLAFLLTVGPTLLSGRAPLATRGGGAVGPVVALPAPSPLAQPAGPVPSRGKVALLAFAAMVGLAAIGAVPLLVGAAVCGVGMVAGRVLSPREVVDSVDAKLMATIAGALALGAALEASGAASALASRMIGIAGDDPRTALVAIYLAGTLLTELVTNNAAAVLLFPVALATAERLGVSPTPFLVALMVAASCSFATPLGYQTNTLVYRLGAYRFRDFLRVGLPMNAVAGVTTIAVTPWLCPF